MNPNLSGPQMRRAEVYTDPSGADHVTHGNDYLGRYDKGEIEAGSGIHSWDEKAGLQGSLFTDPRHTPGEYKEPVSRSLYISGDNEGEALSRIEDSDIPSTDIDRVSRGGLEIKAHDESSWDSLVDPSGAKDGRSFYRENDRSINLHPDSEALIHEMGHAHHYAEGTGRVVRTPTGGYGRAYTVDPMTGADQSPHPVHEGVADGYADRYTAGDNDLRERASTRMEKSETGKSPYSSAYTGSYEKVESDGPHGQTPWTVHDRARYLASRQFTGQTGHAPAIGVMRGDNHTTPHARETGHLLLQADEAKGDGGKQLNDLASEILYPAPTEMSESAGWRQHRHDQSKETLDSARSAAIRYPLFPQNQIPTGDDPHVAVQDASHSQLTTDSPDKGENYRLATFKAAHLPR